MRRVKHVITQIIFIGSLKDKKIKWNKKYAVFLLNSLKIWKDEILFDNLATYVMFNFTLKTKKINTELSNRPGSGSSENYLTEFMAQNLRLIKSRSAY